jgi:hypothetical protein
MERTTKRKTRTIIIIFSEKTAAASNQLISPPLSFTTIHFLPLRPKFPRQNDDYDELPLLSAAFLFVICKMNDAAAALSSLITLLRPSLQSSMMLLLE